MVSSIALGDGGLFAICSELRMAGHLEPVRRKFYSYIIQSISHPKHRYIGHTSDLKQRAAVWRRRAKVNLRVELRPGKPSRI